MHCGGIRWQGRLALVAMATATGCSSERTATLVIYPSWSYEQYETLAVIPFTSRVADAPGAGVQIAAILEDHLRHNRAATCRIIPRADIEALLTASEMAELVEPNRPPAPPAPGRRLPAQALIVGACTRYDTIARRVSDGDVYVHEATVAAELRVLDAATGAILHSVASPAVTLRREHPGFPPEESPDELALRAAEIVAARLARELTVRHVTTRVGSDVLITARGHDGDRWEKQKTFDFDEPALFVVVRRLPPQADRSLFRLEIRREDAAAPLMDEEFVWSSERTPDGLGFEFVPAELVRAAGEGRYEARLYADSERVARRTFRIRGPRDD